jgi:hypothetical protein
LDNPKETRTESFLSFRHKELKADGTKADPLRIVDAQAEQWDNRLIGNGTEVNAKFVVKDYGKGRKKGMYLRAIQILDLVPYVVKDFEPVQSGEDSFKEDSPSEAAPETIARLPEGMEPEVDNLDDDVPV